MKRLAPQKSAAPKRAMSLRLEPLEPRQMLTGVPVITEFMASNDSVSADEDGNFTDWIELYNPDAAPLDLTGWHLTDDSADLTRWQFPAITLGVDEYLLVRASGLNRLGTGPNGEFHTNFGLGGGGEYFALVAPNGVTIEQEFVSNAGEYPPQAVDISYGLQPGTNNETYFLAPTPGAVNSGPTSSNPLHQVVINEIMYHTDSLDATSESQEFIELYNHGSSVVDLSGWRISKGVDFEFPSGTSLAVGGYLVVVADATVFTTKYPAVDSASVFGNWQGKLGNSSERIKLEDVRGDLVDEVTYADKGDWATRMRGPDDLGYRGWVWDAPHDAGGRSLELINPDVTNDHGQNWSSSSVAQGTPGQINSVDDNDIAPLISNIEQSIAIPSSTDVVTITAVVTDESASPVSMSLFYRLDGGGSAFTQIGMADDGQSGDGGSGDRVFGGTIPAQADGAIVEFYVSATDAGSNERTWPAAAIQLDQSLAQTANALYQVDDSFADQYMPGDQPTIYTIMKEVERAELAAIGSGSSSVAESNAQMNGTFIMVDGTGTSVRYTTGVRNRGSSSRSDPPNNFRINLNSDRPWNGIDAVTINSKYTHSQALGGVIYQAAGLVSEDGRAIQLRVNGTNLASTGSTMFGTYTQIEALGGDFASNHFPGDGNGNLYSVRDTNFQEGDLRYEGTDPDEYRDTYFKKTNEEIDDWTDIIGLTDALNNSTDAQFFSAVSAVADLEQWFRFFAADTLLLNEEGGLPTGKGDDYTIYRGVNDPRFVLIPHDLDTLLDQGGSTPNVTRSMFEYEDIHGMERLFTHPETVGLYYKYLLELSSTVFEPNQFSDYVDQTIGSWVSTAVAQNYKDTAAARRSYVLSQIPTQLTVDSTLTSAGPLQILRSTNGSTVGLSGTSHAGDTRSVLVNGVAANWDARAAEWDLGTLPLNPGLNRVIVQAFEGAGGTGQLIDSKAIDIWYDTGSMTEVTTAGVSQPSVTWTAAGGPYHLAQNVVVPAGTTLTIEPGASVFFDEGVELQVEGTLVATGTQFERIRFSSVPDAAFVPDEPRKSGLPDGPPRWAGIHFVDTMSNANIIAFADIEYAQDNANNEGAIGVINSQAVLDNLTTKGTHLRTIYGVNPSWVISNSIFPNVFAPTEFADALGLDNTSEIIKSGGVTPAGGRYIVTNNVFGTNKGHNDVVDADSGRLANGDPIAQFIDNVFLGAGDEQLDLGGDVYVAGNLFMNIYKDDETSDTGYANAISTGDAGADATTGVFRNVFWDVDHAINLKRDSATLFENNTVFAIHDDFTDVHGNPNVGSAINLFVDEPGAVAGKGAYASGNIFSSAPRIFGNQNLPAGTVSQLELIHNFIDPLLANTAPNLGTTPVVGQVSFVDAANGKFELAAGSPAIGTGPFSQDFGAFVPKGAWVTGQPYSVTNATTASLVVGGPGILAYRYRLNGGAWSADIPIGSGFAFDPAISSVRTATLQLTGLADGVQTVEIVGREFGGTWQPSAEATTVSWTVDTVNPLPFDVVINEVLASNVMTVDLGGTQPDYIELFNRGAAAVDLGGYRLTDDIDDPTRYTFPAGTMLPAGGYLVVYADAGASVGGEIHTGFGLKQAGEGVFLMDPSSSVPIDSITFGHQLTDRSIGRLPGAGWGLAVPTLGSANVSQPLSNSSNLFINEWFTTGSYDLNGQHFTDDFIELYNGGVLPVAIGGFYLTDDPVGQPDKHLIEALSFIDAGEYSVFFADNKTSSGHVDFGLSDERGWIGLFDNNVIELDSVFYGPQTSNVSQGRVTDGASEYVFFAQPTPGLDTSPPTVPANLALDAATNSQVDFHWDPSSDPQSGIAQYRIYRDGTLIDTTSGTSYVDQNIQPETTYFYQVSAVNGDGTESALSNSIGNALDTSPPTIPSGVTGTISSASQLVLSWAASSDPQTGIQSYTVLRNGVAIGTATGTTFTDTAFDLASAPPAAYTVTATNGQNMKSAASAAWQVAIFQQGVAPGGYAGASDTWISENDVNANFSDDVELEIDGEDPLETLGLIRWDISSIPAGTAIDDVTITVTVSNPSSGQTYEIYAANQAWTDTEATWINSSNGTPWQTAGARGAQDRDTTVLGAMAMNVNGRFSFDLNAAGVAQVQAWIDNPSTNYGFIISDAANSDGFEFDSSKNTTLTNRPRLEIAYSQNTSLPCDFVGGGNGCDINDIDALYAGTNGSPTPLTNALVAQWLAQASVATNPAKLSTTHTYVYGDTNLDGKVDSIDLGQLLNTFGDTSGLKWGNGNLSADANVDSTDLGLLLNNFNYHSFGVAAASAAAVGSVGGSVSDYSYDEPSDEGSEDDSTTALIDQVFAFHLDG